MVTDDIVTRLRKAHDEAKHWIEGGRWSCPKTIHSEAADEIERLRAEVERLTQSKSVNLYEESLALTLTDIATWDDLQQGRPW